MRGVKPFGYPKFIPWNPANDPPISNDLGNENRNPPYIPQPIPPFFTIEGTPEDEGVIKSACSLAYNRCTNLTITKLGDFTSADHLASELERTWHNRVHGSIGGDMNSFYVARKDPVFWMWHKYIDTVYDKYKEIKEGIGF